MRRTFPLFNCLAVLALAIALSATAYAHRAAPTTLPSDVVAYLKAGGALSDICGLTGEDDAERPVGCDACRIADNADLNRANVDTMDLAVRRTTARAFIAKEAHRRRPLDPTRLTRGPPKA